MGQGRLMRTGQRASQEAPSVKIGNSIGLGNVVALAVLLLLLAGLLVPALHLSVVKNSWVVLFMAAIMAVFSIPHLIYAAIVSIWQTPAARGKIAAVLTSRKGILLHLLNVTFYCILIASAFPFSDWPILAAIFLFTVAHSMVTTVFITMRVMSNFRQDS